jgi:hypothetical protein
MQTKFNVNILVTQAKWVYFDVDTSLMQCKNATNVLYQLFFIQHKSDGALELSFHSDDTLTGFLWRQALVVEMLQHPQAFLRLLHGLHLGQTQPHKLLSKILDHLVIQNFPPRFLTGHAILLIQFEQLKPEDPEYTELAQERPILIFIQSAMAFEPSGFESNKTETETALLSCIFQLKKKKTV